MVGGILLPPLAEGSAPEQLHLFTNLPFLGGCVRTITGLYRLHMRLRRPERLWGLCFLLLASHPPSHTRVPTHPIPAHTLHIFMCTHMHTHPIPAWGLGYTYMHTHPIPAWGPGCTHMHTHRIPARGPGQGSWFWMEVSVFHLSLSKPGML